MHHGKSRGKRNTRKVCKKREFSRGQKKIFLIGGKLIETGKFVVNDYKKGGQKFWRMKIGKFLGKGQIVFFSQSRKNLWETGKNMKLGNASLPRGDGRRWTPLNSYMYVPNS